MTSEWEKQRRKKILEMPENLTSFFFVLIKSNALSGVW